MIIGECRVDFGGAQRRESFANLLYAQTQLPPTRHAMHANATSSYMGFPANNARCANNHRAQICRRFFRCCAHRRSIPDAIVVAKSILRLPRRDVHALDSRALVGFGWTSLDQAGLAWTGLDRPRLASIRTCRGRKKCVRAAISNPCRDRNWLQCYRCLRHEHCKRKGN